MVLLFWTLTVPDCEKPDPVLPIVQEIVLTVTPGATCNAKPIVPTSPSCVDGGGCEQPINPADASVIPRTPTRT